MPKSKTIPWLPLLALSGGEVVGAATFSEDIPAKEAHFHGVHVAEDKLGQGYGMAIYVGAIEKAHAAGEAFRTEDLTQTEDAVRIWTRLADLGVAQVVEPFSHFNTARDGSERFHGHYEVPIPEVTS